MKQLLNSVIAKYRDLSVSRRSIICLSLLLRQIIDLLATDKSRYFAQPRSIPSFSSKCGHVTEKHVPIGCKHEMLGNQTYEVLQPLSKLSHPSLKLFDCRYVFDKQIRPKLQTRYSSVQRFQKWGDSDGGYASNKWNMRKVSYKPLNCVQVHQTISRDRQHRAAFKKAHQNTKQTVVRWFHIIGDDCPK